MIYCKPSLFTYSSHFSCSLYNSDLLMKDFLSYKWFSVCGILCGQTCMSRVCSLLWYCTSNLQRHVYVCMGSQEEQSSVFDIEQAQNNHTRSLKFSRQTIFTLLVNRASNYMSFSGKFAPQVWGLQTGATSQPGQIGTSPAHPAQICFPQTLSKEYRLYYVSCLELKYMFLPKAKRLFIILQLTIMFGVAIPKQQMDERMSYIFCYIMWRQCIIKFLKFLF